MNEKIARQVQGQIHVQIQFFSSHIMTTPCLKFKSNVNSNKKNQNAAGEDTNAGALRAPRTGSPACVFVFVFALIYAY